MRPRPGCDACEAKVAPTGILTAVAKARLTESRIKQIIYEELIDHYLVQQELWEAATPLQYFCDAQRHLVCVPYTLENLHRMAQELGVKRSWFHSGASYPHYDIPKQRIDEISARCTVVSPREILRIVKSNG